MIWLRAVLRVGGALTVLVLLTVGGLHLRPYPYTIGFEVMLPDMGCEPVCVAGVQVGVHHRDDALAVLRAHPMVEGVRENAYGDGSGEILWRWADAYDALYRYGRNYLWYDTDGIVQRATLPTDVPLVDYRVRLGAPDVTQLTDYPGSRDVVVREVYGDVHLSYGYRCLPMGVPVLHTQAVTVLVNPPRRGAVYEVARPIDSLLYIKPCG